MRSKPKKFPNGIKQTYGEMPSTMPAGYFKAVSFPVLVKLDERCDIRKILSDGFLGPRNLPMTIKVGLAGGHLEAAISGALFEVTLDPENNCLSGRGFLLNDDNGRMHARLIHTQAMDRNSIEMADTKVRFVDDMENDDYWFEFYEWALGATCGVAVPAFKDAHAVIDDEMTDDELTASLGDPMEELVSDSPFEIVLLGAPETGELTAGAILAPWDAFHQPEPDAPRKLHADKNGWVSGHVAVWDTCHDGIESQCIVVPRPTDNYASFNKPGVPTERGVVETGPIFLMGGHRSLIGAKNTADAYGGIENAFCDVRVVPGKFGPWASGFVRPGVDPELVYAGLASRISGHWLGGKLKAIVAVNGEGYDVPGSGELAASFEFALNDEGVAELVASFPSCLAETEEDGTDIVLHLKVGSLNSAEVTAAVIKQLGLDDVDHAQVLAELLADEPEL